VGLADWVAPAARPDAVWLTSYPGGAGAFGSGQGRTSGFTQEFSAAGKPLGPKFRLPAGYAIVRATDRGLLLVPVLSKVAGPQYRLWNPVTGKITESFEAVVAAGPHEIAWTTGSGSRRVVHVLDLATGRRTRIVLPASSVAAAGAFSPDGGWLALEVNFGNGGNGGATAIQLEVASLPGGHLSVVPGTWASSDALNGFGWPSSDDSLVAEMSFMTKVQVASWHPGASRLAVAAVGRGQNLIVG